jgi:hypothetical protein
MSLTVSGRHVIWSTPHLDVRFGNLMDTSIRGLLTAGKHTSTSPETHPAHPSLPVIATEIATESVNAGGTNDRVECR